MHLHLIRTALATAALCANFSAAAHESDGKLGSVHFKVSCNAEAQREFDLAMAYYHSFAWEQIRAPLERALAVDAACGITHWARALASLDNPFVWPGNVSAKTLAEGEALMGQARKAGLATQRERDYVDALAVFFQDADKLNHRTRAKALETGLEKVATAYPEDSEAPSFTPWCCRPISTRPTSSTATSCAPPSCSSRSSQATRAPRRRALPDPQLRLPAPGHAGAASGPALQQDRPGRLARAAHAVAHLHACRGLERFGCRKQGVGPGRYRLWTEQPARL